MLNRKYYSIKDAAEILKCTENDVIHYGANGALAIYVLTSKYSIKARRVSRSGDVLTEWLENGLEQKLMKLEKSTLLIFESGDKQTEAKLAPYMLHSNGERIIYDLRHTYGFYPSLDQMSIMKENGIDMAESYPPPILINECEMVVLVDDLNMFINFKHGVKDNDLVEKQVTYTNKDHPLYSKELNIAIEAWQAVLECNPPKTKQKSRKKLIIEWLEVRKNEFDLSNDAIERIAKMLNPDKNGGAPPTLI